MQSGNLYGYALGNPVNYVDPSGEIAVAIPAGVYALAADAAITGGFIIIVYDIASGAWKWVSSVDLSPIEGKTRGSTQGTIVYSNYSLDKIGNALKGIDDNKKNHILQDKHNWKKLVPDPRDPQNWDIIAGYIAAALKDGKIDRYKETALQVTLKIKDATVTVTYKIIDGAIKISDAWVK